MSSFEVAVMSCTECPSPLTYLHHRAFYCGGPSSREGREWTCCLNDVWCTPCEMPGRGGIHWRDSSGVSRAGVFSVRRYVGITILWLNLCTRINVRVYWPIYRTHAIFKRLFSRTAAQSIKLIVPRYRLGKAQFKSELTANKKLPRYTCCISATNQAGERNYTYAWMQDRTRYVC